MSNEVYGYAATRQPEETRRHLIEVAQRENIGLKIITAEELFNFPTERLPTGPHVAFVIGDRPGKETAGYLTDMVDYVPGSLAELPAPGEARLSILLNWIDEVIGNPTVESLFVATCECSEIESQSHVSASEFRARMLDDFHQYAPPNTLYWISK